MEILDFRPDKDSNIPDSKQEHISSRELGKLLLELERLANAEVRGSTNTSITMFETLATPSSEISKPEMTKEPIDDVTVFNTTYPDGTVSGDLD